MANRRSTRNGRPQPQRSTFGQVAVRKGCVSQNQVSEALRIQRSLMEETGKYKPIGMVMLEMGYLGTTELIDVLKEMKNLPGARTSIIRLPARAAAKSRTSKA